MSETAQTPYGTVQFPIEDGTSYRLIESFGLTLADMLEALRSKCESKLIAASSRPVISSSSAYEDSARYGSVRHVVISNGQVKEEGCEHHYLFSDPAPDKQIFTAARALNETVRAILAMRQEGDTLARRRPLQLQRILTEKGLAIVASTRCCWV